MHCPVTSLVTPAFLLLRFLNLISNYVYVHWNGGSMNVCADAGQRYWISPELKLQVVVLDIPSVSAGNQTELFIKSVTYTQWLSLLSGICHIFLQTI